MVKKELIEKLKKSKVADDRKWVYSLIAWALENHTKDIVTFQRRIGSAIHHAKGKYNDYWNNERNRLKHKKTQLQNHLLNEEERLRKVKEYNRERSLVHKLYINGKLSKKSNDLIEKEKKKSNNKKNENQ